MKKFLLILDRWSDLGKRPVRWLQLPVLAAGFLVAQNAPAQQALPFYEPFPASYTNGGTVAPTINGVTAIGTRINDAPASTVWNAGSGGSGNGSPTNHAGAKLTYPGLYSTPDPNVGLYFDSVVTGTRNKGVNFSTVSSGTLYASFLLDVITAPTANRLVTFLTSDAAQFTGSSVVGLLMDNGLHLMVSKNSSSVVAATTTGAMTPNTTNLVVVRYTWNTDADDEVAVWLNPGSLGSDTAPTPDASGTTGTDFSDLDYFFFQQRNNSSSQGAQFLMDELRIGTSWKDVTPTQASCVAASFVVDPTNQTVIDGLSTKFTAVSAGTGPSYQWQLSTDGGNTWNSVTGGSGANSSSYTTPFLTVANNNNRYRAVANVACGGGSSATSAVAVVTVNAAVFSTNGVLVDDTWEDYLRNNTPFQTNNSIWYGTSGTLTVPAPGDMEGVPGTGSTLWLGYFIDTAAVPPYPAHLDVGKMLKLTLTFSADNVVTNGGGSMRIGLFDYSDATGFVTDDSAAGGSTGGAAGVRGYMLVQNWGTNFTDNTPMDLFARTVLDDGNLMGTTGDYQSIGSGPTNGTFTNIPAFQSGTTYALEFSVARTTLRSVDVTTKFSGPGLNLSYTVTDTNYVYQRFDTIGIRANNAATTADLFHFAHFLVQVTNAPVAAPSAIPLNAALSGNNIVLTWANPAFTKILSASSATGPWTTNQNVASPYTNSVAGGTQKYYRLLYP